MDLDIIANPPPQTFKMTEPTLGRLPAMLACFLAVLALFLFAGGTMMQYQQPMLAAGTATQGVILILVSIGVWLLAMILAVAALICSRRWPGWVALVLCLIVLASSIALPMFFRVQEWAIFIDQGQVE